MMDRIEWLQSVHDTAYALIASDGYEERFARFLREDQLGKWRLDNVSGYYWYLHALVLATRPKKIVELGRCLGTSALFMLGALDDDATLITVDVDERASDLTHQLGDPRLRILTGNDLDLATFDGVDITPEGRPLYAQTVLSAYNAIAVRFSRNSTVRLPACAPTRKLYGHSST